MEMLGPLGWFFRMNQIHWCLMDFSVYPNEYQHANIDGYITTPDRYKSSFSCPETGAPPWSPRASRPAPYQYYPRLCRNALQHDQFLDDFRSPILGLCHDIPILRGLKKKQTFDGKLMQHQDLLVKTIINLPWSEDQIYSNLIQFYQ